MFRILDELETPEGGKGPVIVTFLSSGKGIDLGERGIDEGQAADLRHRLKTLAQDWDQPEMDVYDDE